MVLIAVISGGCGLAPIIGGNLSVVVIFILLMKWTDEGLSPDGVLWVVVARLVEMASRPGASRLVGQI